MTFRLKGGPELLQLLDQLPKNLERNVIRGGLRAGAKVIQQQAKANVPVKTGQLKRAIGIGTRTDGAKLSSYIKLRGKGSYLGLFIEYGVAPHLISVSDADTPVRQTRHGPRKVSIGTINKMLKRGSLRIGENFVGLYLRGSLAYGDATPATSDIDALAVTEAPVTDPELAALGPVAGRHDRRPALVAGPPHPPSSAARSPPTNCSARRVWRWWRPRPTSCSPRSASSSTTTPRHCSCSVTPAPRSS